MLILSITFTEYALPPFRLEDPGDVQRRQRDAQ